MRIKALTFERYRIFKDRYRIELAPITIIIGKNGSGKSVISRLPLILSAALAEKANGPLDLTAGGVSHGASFLDLVNKRSSLPFSLGAEIGDDHSVIVFETTFRYVSEKRALAIEKFSLHENGVSVVEMEISDADELTLSQPKYSIKAAGITTIQSVEFNGMFPTGDGLSEVLRNKLQTSLQLFRDAIPPPSYLGPFRAEPNNFLRTPAQSISNLGPRGEQALDFLSDDRLRHGGHLAQEVADWFATAMDQEVLVDVSGEQPKISVGSRAASGFRTSLSDTGAGFSQAIPVVVQNFAYRVGRISAPILVVEQPELHLHPAAHGALADLFRNSALPGKTWQGATCIVETHSEQLIMRIRRRIAEGLNPRHVKLLSLSHIESTDESSDVEELREINFDSSGNPDSWPAGVFEESLEDLTAMRKAQRGEEA